MQWWGRIFDDILNALNNEGRNKIVWKTLTQIQWLVVDRQLDKFNPENERTLFATISCLRGQFYKRS